MSVVDRGDLVYISFTPQAGVESRGRRPAIVLSPKEFNEKTQFVSVCPITNRKKGWGYEVELPEGLAITGVILTDHLKNLDYNAREIVKVGSAPTEIVEQCLDKIATFLSY